MVNVKAKQMGNIIKTKEKAKKRSKRKVRMVEG